jgi:hypothetical protein
MASQNVRYTGLSMSFRVSIALLLAFFSTSIFSTSVTSTEPCCIKIIDDNNGWPVPLVELRTTHQMRFVSDNAGVIAFDLPELMNRETWFHVIGHGYSVPKDGFGNSGVRLTPREGETITVKVKRQLPAKRLGRITGGGLFAESQKLGLESDWQESGILGCDSVQNAVHDGKLFWSWGDTTLAGYPLGLFDMIGATTELQPLQSFQPPIRLKFNYIADSKGSQRTIAKMPGDGPTWLGGFASLVDKVGNNRLVATYMKIKPPLEQYECGLCVWNEQAQEFEKNRVLWTKSAQKPTPNSAPLGHPVKWFDADGKPWMLFGDPFPSLKCPSDFESWSDPQTWQLLKPQESVLVRHSDETVTPHRGAIAWNAYRKKWISIFTQMGGKSSFLGELWYAEADSPIGPWNDAVHVVTHTKYTFYNPQLHSEFTEPDSPILLFEATYTKEFSGASEATPRHDYNQVLYRLDLDELHDQ